MWKKQVCLKLEKPNVFATRDEKTGIAQLQEQTLNLRTKENKKITSYMVR